GNGTFYVAQTPTGTGGITLERAVQWGQQGDNPTGVGDYDGDGKSDYTIVRVVGGNFVWYIINSSTSTMRAVTFGTRTGLPPASSGGFKIFPGADFTGDGRDELVLVTALTQNRLTYRIGDAVTGEGVITRDFGTFNQDINLPPDDYTGDGRADFVAVRQADGDPATIVAIWYILNVAANTLTATPFGFADENFESDDSPVRGDFDGDRRHDIAVYRNSIQTFFWINSSDRSIRAQKAPAQLDDIALGSIDSF
ncbi:MAG: hypothetical protein ACR2HT_00915, partial [Pyrinomonadaceae bacterium]